MRYDIGNRFSGKRFDRPAFQKMLQDIQKSNMDCIVAKDISCLGRDYITVNYYLEMFFLAKVSDSYLSTISLTPSKA